MAKPKVVVTRRLPAAVEAALGADFDVTFNMRDRALSVAELREAVLTADAVLPTVTDRIDDAVLGNGKHRTRILANFGVGYNHIDVALAKSCGIAITNTPDVLSECTADLTLALMLMVARRAGEGAQELITGGWHGWRPTHLLGTKVSGKTLGIVGFGRIGREVARRAYHGFGMPILVYNRSPVVQKDLDAYGAKQIASLDDLLPQAEGMRPDGLGFRHLIDARRLNLMKPTAFLINTARGDVIDEFALANALWFDTIAGAGLDVFSGEPNVLPELMSCQNAILLPHLGSATRETREAMGFRVVQNLTDYFAGRTPRDLVV